MNKLVKYSFALLAVATLVFGCSKEELPMPETSEMAIKSRFADKEYVRKLDEREEAQKSLYRERAKYQGKEDEASKKRLHEIDDAIRAEQKKAAEVIRQRISK